MSWLRILAVLYVVALHALVLVAALRPVLFSTVLQRVGLKPPASFYHEKVAYQLLADAAVPAGATILIGDSQLQGLDADAFDASAVNYGIGGDTSLGVLQRLPLYGSIGRAGAIVIEIGTNDLGQMPIAYTIANLEQIFASIPAKIPIAAAGILPVAESKSEEWRQPGSRNQAIRELNRNLKTICAGRHGCIFVDATGALADATGNLAAQYDLGDGLHLNAAGYRVWGELLKAALPARPGN